MGKKCLACGFINIESSDECPKCKKFYIKTDAIYNKESNKKISINKNNPNKKYKFYAVYVLIFIAGYFSGREHIKYEFREAMENVGKSYVEAFSAVKTLGNNIIIPKEDVQKDIPNNWRETCSSYSDMAESIMSARQNGMQISDLIETVKNMEGNKEAERLILIAYKKPRFSILENQEKSIRKFKNESYVACAPRL